MLQRPQTLYLLGAFILSIFLFTGPLAEFMMEGGELALQHSGVTRSDGSAMKIATWPLTVLFILIAGLSFLNIFLYRNRVRQMRICTFLMFLNLGVVGMVFYYIFVVKSHVEGLQTVHQWRIVIPAISIILLYLALRRIRRDELLVKAYDRIR
jgi:uncharacterized membrane protein